MDDLIAALCFQLPADAESIDGWYRLIPAPGADGLVRGRDGRSWRLTDPQAVADAFTAPLPVDVNHAEELRAPSGNDAPAYAWIEAVESRPDGIYGRFAFNERGIRAVNGREYRFVSPVFSFDKNTREIRQLNSAALVNSPNFALALNRRGLSPADDIPSAEIQTEATPMALLEALIAKLDLPADTDEDAALNAVAKLTGDLATARNRAATPSLDKFVPRADYDQQVERARNAEQTLATHETEAQETKIEDAITAAQSAGKITPATADYHRAQCRVDGGLERFEQYVAAAPVIGEPSALEGKTADAKPAGGALSDAERAACRAMGVAEATYRERREADVKAFG